AVRDALRRYSATLMGPPVIDLDAALEIRDAGDIAEPDGDEGEAAVIARVRELAPAFVIALGGDNSLTYPVALGAAASGLITFDAHFDLRDGVSNGTPVRRLVEDDPAAATFPTERIDPTRIVQIGIADFANSAAYAQRAADWGIRVITLDEVRRRGAADVVVEALEIAGAAEGRVHLDIDVDVCDRAVAPGCPASVPGGLAAWELRALTRAVASDARVVSADIAEVDATADAEDGRTVRLAALCVLELLAGLALRAR
ncbi:MAG: arginase family protein, partial [Microbacterium sp.]